MSTAMTLEEVQGLVAPFIDAEEGKLSANAMAAYVEALRARSSFFKDIDVRLVEHPNGAELDVNLSFTATGQGGTPALLTTYALPELLAAATVRDLELLVMKGDRSDEMASKLLRTLDGFERLVPRRERYERVKSRSKGRPPRIWRPRPVGNSGIITVDPRVLHVAIDPTASLVVQEGENVCAREESVSAAQFVAHASDPAPVACSHEACRQAKIEIRMEFAVAVWIDPGADVTLMTEIPRNFISGVAWS